MKRNRYQRKFGSILSETFSSDVIRSILSNPTDTLQALNESKLDAKIQNTTQSAKNKLKKFNNGDFSIRYNDTFPHVRQDLRKLLALNLQGRSDYAVYDTPNGRLAFRLTDHNANGNNFEQDEADINLSVYVAFEEFDHVECSIHYKEYRIASDVFEANREACINAIINGVHNALEGKEFEIDNSIAQMTEYNKPITCKVPSDDENNQENLNCNRNMNKNRIRLTESQLHNVIKESVHKMLNEIIYGGTLKERNPYDKWDGGFGDNWTDEQWSEYDSKQREKGKNLPNRDYFNKSNNNYENQSQYSPEYMSDEFEMLQRTDDNGKKHFKRIPKSSKYSKFNPKPINTDEWKEQYRDSSGYRFLSKGSGSNKQWKKVKVSESRLHKVIKESVNKILKATIYY